MALTAIQTEKWAATIDAFLTTMTVSTRICDTNLVIEGGDIWHIVQPTDVSVTDVSDSADITYAAQTDTNYSVTKNFDKYFALLILDTDRMQTSVGGWEAAYAQNGAYQLGAALDTAVFSNYGNAGSDSYETGTTDWQFTVNTCADIPRFFATLANTLQTNKVDSLGRPYVVGPPGLGEAVLTYTGGRTTDLGDTVLLSGNQRMFPFMGFDVYISNNLETETSSTHGFCGITGYGYALGKYITPSMVEVVGRAEGRFGDLVRGRLAAGYKIYRSAAVIDVNLNSTVVATS